MSDTPTGPEPQRSSPESPAGEVPTTDPGDGVTAEHRATEHRAAEDRAGEFVSALPAATDRAGRNDAYARAGMIVMVLGLAAAVVAVVLSQMSDNALDQSTQISLGIAGLASTCFGGVIFLRYSMGDLLRYWLLRMLHEQHGGDAGPKRG